MTYKIKSRILRWAGLVFIGLFSLLIAEIAFAQTPVEIVNSFRTEWRTATLSVLESDLKKQPKCELKKVVETVERIRFFGDPTLPKNIKAAVYPNIKSLQDVVFINTNLKWSIVDAVVTTIHEAAHLTRLKDRWMCGPDNERPANRDLLRLMPPCRLFGEIQYNSMQITEAIRKHLEVELKQLGESIESSIPRN